MFTGNNPLQAAHGGWLGNKEQEQTTTATKTLSGQRKMVVLDEY